MKLRAPLIKICGIKTEEEIRLINKYKVSYIGFIFAKSKRQLKVDQAIMLRDMVRADIKVVAVFLDNDMDFILEVVKKCCINVIQLHGNEDDYMIKALKSNLEEVNVEIKIWKSMAIKDADSLLRIRDYPSADGLLLDTYYKGQVGGTGHVFNWDLIKELDYEGTLILAGGLTPDNVVKAYTAVNPDILDLNSGLEVALVKDASKVNSLFNKLKEVYDE